MHETETSTGGSPGYTWLLLRAGVFSQARWLGIVGSLLFHFLPPGFQLHCRRPRGIELQLPL